MARPPKPTAVLNRQGTSRKDRHAKRESEPHSDGKPLAPRWLKGDALRFWQATMPHFVRMGIVEAVDSHELAALAQSWANWRTEQRRYEKGDGHIYAVSNAMKLWSNLASKFGMSPIDRIKLATKAKEEDDPLLDILRGSLN